MSKLSSLFNRLEEADAPTVCNGSLFITFEEIPRLPLQACRPVTPKVPIPGAAGGRQGRK